MSKAKSIAVWIAIGLTSLAFVAAGSAKLMGVEQLHLSFSLMGLPVWFGYFIGACELLGGLALWYRKTSFYSAAGLLIIMLGAVYFHLVYDAAANAIPAVILSALLVAILSVRQQDRFKL